MLSIFKKELFKSLEIKFALVWAIVQIIGSIILFSQQLILFSSLFAFGGISFLGIIWVTRNGNFEIKVQIYLVNLLFISSLTNFFIRFEINLIGWLSSVFFAYLIFSRSLIKPKKILWFILLIISFLLGYIIEYPLSNLGKVNVFESNYILSFIGNLFFLSLIITFLTGLKNLNNHTDSSILNKTLMVANVPGLCILINENGEILETNHKYNRELLYLFGKSIQVGDILFDFLLSDSYRAPVLKAIAKAFQGKIINAEASVPVGKLGKRYLEFTYIPISRPSDNKRLVLVYVLDNTEKVNKDQNLIVVNESLSKLPFPIFVSDENSQLVFSNKSARNLLLHFQGNYKLLPDLWKIEPDIATKEIRQKQVIANGKSYTFSIISFDNKAVWVCEQQPKMAFQGYKEVLFDLVLDKLPYEIAIFDTEHRYLFVNNAAIADKEIRNWILGKTDFDYFNRKNAALNEAEKRQSYFRRVIETGKEVSWIDQFYRNGNFIKQRRTFYPVYDETETLVFILGFGLDITEFSGSVAALERQYELLQEILNILPLSIYLIDRTNKYRLMNNAGARMAGYKPSEMIGKHVFELFDEELTAKFIEQDNQVWEEGVAVFYEDKLNFSAGELTGLCGKKLINLEDEQFILGFTLDISETKRLEKEVRAARKQIEQIIDAAPCLIYANNADGVFTLINQAVSGMFGLTQSNLVGKTLFELHKKNASIELSLNRDKQVLEMGKPIKFEEIFELPDKTKKSFQTLKTPIIGLNGNVEVLTMSTDVTAQRNLEAQFAAFETKVSLMADWNLQYLSATIIQLNQTIKEIESSLSVDPKIQISDSELPKVLASFYNINYKLLLQRELLHIKEGKCVVSPIAFELKSAIEDSLKDFNKLIEVNRLSVVFAKSSEELTWVFADLNKTKMVLSFIWASLIRNAENQRILFSIQYLAESDFFVFNWTIAGFVFQMENEENLITFVDAFLGKITIDTTNSATEIALKLKLKRIAKPNLNFDCHSFSKLKKMRFLVAEDNKLNQLIINKLFSKFEHTLVIVENGQEALAKLQTETFDILLMDLQMPLMNGFEATLAIRNGDAGEKNKAIPIIALTADAFEETAEEVLEIGMNGLLSKPINLDHLAAIIDKIQNNL